MHVERSELELELLVARIDRDELDHQPDRPRDQAWNEASQQRLIDTILRDWCIPPIHIAAGHPGGPEIVLDGRLRLHTITRFFHDELPCPATLPRDRPDTTRLEGLRFSDLPAHLRRRVRRFRLTVITLFDYHPEELTELLDRLDRPAAPSAASVAPEYRLHVPATHLNPTGAHELPITPRPSP